MDWWTSRGRMASDRTIQKASLLSQCAGQWGQRVIHVFDRGFAGATWLGELGGHRLRFIMRWPARYNLEDALGSRPAWEITRGKRSRDHRQIRDFQRRQDRKTGIVFAPVRHPGVAEELWLVASRLGKGLHPGTC
jgi:hypothetical protein